MNKWSSIQMADVTILPCFVVCLRRTDDERICLLGAEARILKFPLQPERALLADPVQVPRRDVGRCCCSHTKCERLYRVHSLANTG